MPETILSALVRKLVIDHLRRHWMRSKHIISGWHIFEENRMSLTTEPRKLLSKTVYSSKCSVSIKFVAAHFVFHCSQRLSNNFPMRMLVGLQVAIVFIGWFSVWHFNDPRSPRGLNRSSFSWLFSWAHLAAAHSRRAQSQALFPFLAAYFRCTFWQLFAFVELRGAFSVARWFRLDRLTAARLRWAARCSFLCSLVLFGISWKLLACVLLRGALLFPR